MPVINFSPLDEKQKAIGEFLSRQELTDFRECCETMREQMAMSYLFRDIDPEPFFKAIMEKVREKHFGADGTIHNKAVQGICELYGEQMDLDEFYENFLR